MGRQRYRNKDLKLAVKETERKLIKLADKDIERKVLKWQPKKEKSY